jgi:peptide/nickel transport system permease protein
VLKFIFKKLVQGLLVLIGVIILVFLLFQGFGDPSRLVMGQSGDASTQAAIRKELNIDQPKWKQFILYLNDVSPLSIHSKEDIRRKKIEGLFYRWQYKAGY